MAKKKKLIPKVGEIEYTTNAEPKAWAGGIPVFCAHDAIVPIDKLRPNPQNPNHHPPEQLELLGKIIRGQGWRGPITISNRSGLIVRGHGRLMAAQLEELSEAPVDYQNYASEAEEMADLVADNRIAELSDINTKMLAEVFADIDTGEIPFMLTGYTEEDYENIVTALSEALHDEVKESESEPEEELMTKNGDLWILGNYRVMCGGDYSNQEERSLLEQEELPGLILKLLSDAETIVVYNKANESALIMEPSPELVDNIVRRYILAIDDKNVYCIRKGKKLSPQELFKGGIA